MGENVENSCNSKLLMATVSQFGNFLLPAAFNYSVFARQLSSLSSVHVEFNSTNSSMQSIARGGGGGDFWVKEQKLQ